MRIPGQNGARKGNLRTAANAGLSLAFGLGFTLLLFLAVAHVDKPSTAPASSEIVDLREVALAPEPPPPPPTREVQTAPTEAADVALTGIEIGAAVSPVKIAVSPPDLDFILPPPQVAPPATIRFNALETTFKPGLSTDADPNHIFQQSEVDRVPTALYREAPPIPSRVRRGASRLVVVFVVTVEPDGTVSSIREIKSSGNPEFDSLMSDCVRDRWAFSPAIRKGKKVRCLVQQQVIVRWEEGSLFSS